MFDEFTHVVAEASTWAYVILFAFALLDAIVPAVPSEASVITAGVVASSGELALPLVLVAAALGAFAGDNAGYLLGNKLGDRVKRRFFSGDRGSERVAWAERALRRRGGELIVAGRFVPGGRTAVTLTAGATRYPWVRFARYDAIAAVSWATYAGLLGYWGGRAFEDAPWKGLVLAFGVAGAIALAVEGVRRLRRSRATSSGHR